MENPLGKGNPLGPQGGKKTLPSGPEKIPLKDGSLESRYSRCLMSLIGETLSILTPPHTLCVLLHTPELMGPSTQAHLGSSWEKSERKGPLGTDHWPLGGRDVTYDAPGSTSQGGWRSRTVIFKVASAGEGPSTPRPDYTLKIKFNSLESTPERSNVNITVRSDIFFLFNT